MGTRSVIKTALYSRINSLAAQCGGRGGARVNSGRKPLPEKDKRKALVLYVTAAERKQIEAFVKELFKRMRSR